MDARAENQPPFDERAVLEELERLRDQIEQQQAERRKAEEEFERFVGSFKAGADAAPPSLASSPEPQAIEAPAVAVASAAPLPIAPTAITPEAAHAPADETPSRRRPSGAVVGGLAVVVLVAGGLLIWTQRDGEPESVPAASPPAETVPQPGAPEPAAAVPLAPPPRAELTTIRPVWVRVIADGQRVLEREIPAGSRVPLAVQKVVVIRTGDAGAVRLSIAGEDRGFLGREGEVVTRTFNLSSPSVR